MGNILILGGGVTGLAAGIASDGIVIEASSRPGGLIDSYSSGDSVISKSGHWLFGGRQGTVDFVTSLVNCKQVKKDTRAWIDGEIYNVPVQANIGQFREAPRIYAELAARPQIETVSFAEWLRAMYGQTLYLRFFKPLNLKYTDGLYHDIIPFAVRNPTLPLESLLRNKGAVSYNDTFLAVIGGTHNLAAAMASKCKNLRLGETVQSIDLDKKLVKTSVTYYSYDRIVSTIPLPELLVMCGLPGPELLYLSVFCVNVIVGEVLFPGQWMYVADENVPFHRIGNYTAIDPSLATRKSVYIDCNRRPDFDPQQVGPLAEQCVRAAVDSGMIADVERWTTMSVKYGLALRRAADGERIASVLSTLASHNIFSIGSFGGWHQPYQGVMVDIEDGLTAGMIAKELAL